MHALRLLRRLSTRRPSSSAPLPSATGLEEWNDAWETAWLPQDDVEEEVKKQSDRAPWEDVGRGGSGGLEVENELDGDTKAFVAEMDERWNERKAAKNMTEPKSTVRMKEEKQIKGKRKGDEYRLKKQRIHAGLWVKEIEKLEESSLGGTGGDDIDRLLDSCSEIFEVGNEEAKTLTTTQLKTKPDGWENTSKNSDINENIWDISQREEDILLQEFERRIAFTKHQIGSFLKTHIFSRRRPIDGWKYMIEEIGPNARRGKGSVNRLPNIADSALQPFKDGKESGFGPSNGNSSFRRR